MIAPIQILFLIPFAGVFVVLVLIPRLRMERRARALLTQNPGAQRTSVYLPFHSTLADGKRVEMDAKISEMGRAGWTFLRATEANPFRTICSWGGGLKMHFIRRNSSAELQSSSSG